jgi:hypothetical protein
MNIATITALHATIAASSIFRCGAPKIDLPAALIALADAVHAMDHTDDSTESMWSTVGEHTECPLGDLITGAYWALSQWHGGQSSDTYAALCALGRVFKPGCTSGPESESGEETVFDLINQHFDELHNAPEPGSWYHKPESQGQGIIICEKTGRNVAVVYDEKDSLVIAAAPDLLEALHQCLPLVDAHRSAALGEGDLAAMNARAAIAKATGH